MTLAVGLAIDRTTKQADDETPAPDWLESRALGVLETNWGQPLNEQIHLAIKRQPYLAETKSQFAAPTYGEVLRRVAESPLR